jgi:tetratricopeptide (TPR) repeat protein
MKKLISSILFLASFAALSAQVEQTVIVQEYNESSKKTPLSQVGVTVMNAGAAISDENGQATLRFRTLHAGDKVTIRRIEKAGYEIFNSQAIEQWTISPQQPFRIVLCRSDRFKALRDEYNRVASDSYARQYKAEQARLAEERKRTNMLEETYKQKLLDLENQYQQQLEDLDNYVDQFARIDLSELSSRQAKLIRMVKEGKIDEAIREYESKDYKALYERECQEIAKIDEAQARLARIEAKKRSERDGIFQAITRQVNTYFLAGGRENFRKANELLKSVADADTTNLEAVYTYGVQAVRQRNLTDCETYLNIYIRGCAGKPEYQANGHIYLGEAYLQMQDFEKAIEQLQKGLSIRKEIARTEPERMAASVLEAENHLVTCYRWLGNVEGMISMLKEAIPTAEKLNEEEPEVYGYILPSMYSSYGLALFYSGETERARTEAQKGVDLSRQHYENDKGRVSDDTRSQSYTYSLTNLSQICYLMNDWQALADAQLQYVAIVEPQYKQNPDAIGVYLQGGYNNLAEAYLHLEDYAECEKYFLQAEQLQQSIENNSAKFDAYNWFNLADIGAHLYQALGNTEKMQHYISVALKNYEGMIPEAQAEAKPLYDALKAMKGE